MSDQIEDFRALVAFMRQLAGDVGTYMKLLAGNKSIQPFLFRSLIQTVFANIEATASVFRRIATNMLLMEGHVSVTKLAMLQEHHYTLSNTGKLHQERQKQGTTKLLAFTLRTAAAAAGFSEAEIEAKFGGAGWNAILDGTKVRDRLTHPKNPSDLEITHEELLRTLDGANWFQDFSWEIYERTTKDRLFGSYEMTIDGEIVCKPISIADLYGAIAYLPEPRSPQEPQP